MSNNQPILVATHNGTFHFDDLLAAAMVRMLHPGQTVEIVRTRDQAVISSADWVIDVGGVYDHVLKRYDHHQKDSPVRPNGVPYAASGLVWKHWGAELCGDQKVADLIDVEFIQMIDGPDNGMQTFESLIEGGRVPSINSLSVFWAPQWDEPEANNDEQFFELLNFAQALLVRLIVVYNSRQKSDQAFSQAYQESPDKELILVEKGVSPTDVTDYPKVKFLIYQDLENDTWKAKCISEGSFKCRTSFPITWRGFRGQELQDASKLSTAEFVHPAGFLAVAKTKEGILSMCQQALS